MYFIDEGEPDYTARSTYHTQIGQHDHAERLLVWNETTVEDGTSLSRGFPRGSVLAWSLGSIAFLFMLCCCVKPRIPPPSHRRGSQIAARAREIRQRKEQINQWSDPRRRKALLRRSLCVRRVVRVNHTSSPRGEGRLTMIETTQEPQLKLSPTDSLVNSPTAVLSMSDADSSHVDKSSPWDLQNDENKEKVAPGFSLTRVEQCLDHQVPVLEHVDDDSLDHCCAICLEPFRVDELVAWSRSATPNFPLAGLLHVPAGAVVEAEATCSSGSLSQLPSPGNSCNHAFHRDCIYLWLRNPQNDTCPSCRSVILEYSEYSRGLDKDVAKDKDDAQGQVDTSDQEMSEDVEMGGRCHG